MTDELPLLSVRALNIDYRLPGRTDFAALRNIDLDLRAGQVAAVVGESGSGKSTLGRAITGTLADNAAVRGGEIRFDGKDLLRLSPQERRILRGNAIGYIPQDAQVSLDPLVPVGLQASSALRVHSGLSRADRYSRIVELFARVGLREPEKVFHRYAHELSGGMCQRVLIAAALSAEPKLIVADEPTSALDVTVQRTILDLIDGLAEDAGLAVLLITHDLGVATDRADSVLVLQHGVAEEHGAVEDVVIRPQAAYTRRLIAASGIGWAGGRMREGKGASLSEGTSPLIVVDDVSRSFTVRRRRGSETVAALRNVSLTVRRGTTLGIVGESGSGKTTLARIISGLERADNGVVVIDGAPVKTEPALRKRAHVPLQLVYQNPFASLDPRQQISTILEEPLTGHRKELSRRERIERVRELVGLVDLPQKVLGQYPGELSGGQRQRVAIARALAPNPGLLVLDEPVSALDVSVQAQVLQLLRELQESLGLTYVFISHDLSVIDAVTDRVAVLHHGELVEIGDTYDILRSPSTEYVRSLVDAVPGARFRNAMSTTFTQKPEENPA